MPGLVRERADGLRIAGLFGNGDEAGRLIIAAALPGWTDHDIGVELLHSEDLLAQGGRLLDHGAHALTEVRQLAVNGLFVQRAHDRILDRAGFAAQPVFHGTRQGRRHLVAIEAKRRGGIGHVGQHLIHNRGRVFANGHDGRGAGTSRTVMHGTRGAGAGRAAGGRWHRPARDAAQSGQQCN